MAGTSEEAREPTQQLRGGESAAENHQTPAGGQNHGGAEVIWLIVNSRRTDRPHQELCIVHLLPFLPDSSAW